MNNIKIMKTKPTLSDEEIRSHMDFDKLLARHTATVPAKSNWPMYVGSGAVVVVISALMYWAWPDKTSGSETQVPNNQPVIEQRDSIQQTGKRIENEMQQEQETSQPNKLPVSPKSTEAVPQESPTVPVFIEAEPIEGYQHLYEYFGRELTYPVDQVDSDVEGVVSVSFAIDEKGKPKTITISNSLGESFDKECIRVIENMPAWRAATINGKPRTTRLSIPLTFKINQNQ